MLARSSLFTIALGTLLLGCTASGSGVCEDAAAHLEDCGLTEASAASGAALECDAAAAALAEEVLALDCSELVSAGKADGGGHGAGDDFQCTFLHMTEECACIDWSGYYSASDFSNKKLTGRVLDADTMQPVALPDGQWLEVKTANSGGSYDTQRVGARVDATGQFGLSRLECDRTDLRVRVNDATTVPAQENTDPTYGGRNALVATIVGVQLINDGYYDATVFHLEDIKAPITVLVRLGVERRLQ